jgi:hypothetical protein
MHYIFHGLKYYEKIHLSNIQHAKSTEYIKHVTRNGNSEIFTVPGYAHRTFLGSAVKCICSGQFITKFALRCPLYVSSFKTLMQDMNQNTHVRILTPEAFHPLINHKPIVCMYVCMHACVYLYI